jgi:hypothetical protein
MAAVSTLAVTSAVLLASGSSSAADQSPGLVGTTQVSVFRHGANRRLALLDTGSITQTSQTSSNDPKSTGTIPIVLRNNTTRTLTAVHVHVTARDHGKVVGYADSDRGLIVPAAIAPGELGIGQLNFKGSLGGGTPTYDYSYTAKLLNPGRDAFVGLEVVSHELRPGTALPLSHEIVGAIRNPLGVAVANIHVVAVCFDTNGTPFQEEDDKLAELAPGATGSFDIVSFLSVGNCPTYLVGASGVARR